MTDYDLPEWWHDEKTTPEDKHRWFCEERQRRRVMKQDMPVFDHMLHEAEREQRKESARNGTVDLEDMR